ncbi:MAG: VacJ family lipoprotein [Polaromonas sp.]|nr:VacJ family lipoprotein [Polaromonas sp.]
MTSLSSMTTVLRLAAAGLALALVQGCATGPNPADPLEPFNRSVFKFNDGLDRAVLRPVATAYRDVTPSPVRTGVTNFFSNIGDVWSLVNNVLQAKPKESVETLMRISFNTIFGFAGVFDIASEMRLQKHTEDFGQTLGYWGMESGAYVVLPVFGSSTMRDTIGAVVDTSADLVTRTNRIPVRNSATGLRVVNGRANLLGAGDVVDQAALDKYSFTRDAYLQRRRSLIGRDAAEVEERYDLPEGATPGAAATPASAAPASR